MNPIQRKANTVEMTKSNDHRDVSGGLGRRLRRPRLLPYAALVAVVAAVPVAAGSAAGPSMSKPGGLKTFVKRLGEPRKLSADGVPQYSRTPSFAWRPVRGATRYEFELSTSNRFRADNGVIWSSKTLTTPAAAVPISLPWITGPSLYWHVRALGSRGVSKWSATGRFNMRWTVGVPQPIASGPGYVSWTPIEGATGYDVWFGNLGSQMRDGVGVTVGKIVSTITTVADEREYSTLRAPGDAVQWRVRARRALYGSTKNGLPRVSYGPWSSVYSAPAGPSSETDAVAKPLRTVSSAGAARVHDLMPAFVFSRDAYKFHRVFVATDQDCVNVVHVGSIVGGNAYAPRTSGPLALSPEKWNDKKFPSFLIDGTEGEETLRADGEIARTNESAPKQDASANTASTTEQGPAPVDLWDSNWPNGRYYWTVVPVTRYPKSDQKETAPTATEEAGEQQWIYQDLMLPQDACQAGNVLEFGRKSVDPSLGSRAVPFATGLSPNGRLHSASSRRSSFYGAALVAWTPATGATSYDVEWSRTSYPWRAAGRQSTPATSAMLPLRAGTWWYRVRGINPYLPGNQKMSWSNPVRLRIASPTFRVVRG
jgi:hypothetical protein